VLTTAKDFRYDFGDSPLAAWRTAEEEEQEIPDEPMTMQNDLHEEKSEEVNDYV
jgi:hypothetical protein